MVRLFFLLFFVGIFIYKPSFAQTAVDSKTYEDCMIKAQTNERRTKCYLDEAKRFMNEIEAKYAKLSKLPKIIVIRDVSKDPQEYFRKMLNAWKFHIKSYCDIKGVVDNNYSGDGVSYCRAECLYYQTKNQLNSVGDIELSYYSTLAN